MFWDKIKEAFSKKENNDNKAIINTQKTEKNRFTMVVKSVNKENTEGIFLEGFVCGTVGKEEVTLLFKDGKILHLKIAKIKDKTDNELEFIKDSYAKLFFEGMDGNTSDFKYALITNIEYQIEADVNRAAENPYILGLLYEYEVTYTDEDFINLFFREMVRAHYLLPVSISGNIEGRGEITLKEDTKIDVYGIGLEGGINALPVFTDWIAVKNWADNTLTDWKQQTVIVRFPDILGFLKSGEGFIINPYGPHSFYMNSKSIESIVNSSGYKSEFGEAKIERKVAKGGEKNLLGYPADNEEVLAIKRRLKAFGNSHSEINMIDIMLRVDEEGIESYLIIIDIDDTDVRKYYTAIYENCRDLLHHIVYMDFATLEQAYFAKDMMRNPPLYKKIR